MKKFLMFYFLSLLISIQFLPNGYAQDFTQWNLPEGAKMRLGKGEINDIKFSPDGNLLAVGTSIGIWIYDVQTRKEVNFLKSNKYQIDALMFIENGKKIVSAGVDGPSSRIITWEAKTDSSLDKLIMQKYGERLSGTGYIWSSALSHNGNLLAVGNGSGSIHLVDTRTGNRISTFKAHSDSVNGLAFSLDSSTLVSGSTDSKIYMWDVATQKRQQTLTRLSETHAIAFSPDGKRVANGNFGGGLYIWDIESKQKLMTFKGHTDAIRTLAYSPDGKMLASGSWDKTIRLWDTKTGNQIAIINGHPHFVERMALAPDGNYVSGTARGLINIWDTRTRQEIHSQTRNEYSLVRGLAFTNNSTQLYSVNVGFELALTDASNNQKLFTKQFKGHKGANWAISFNPSRTIIANAYRDMNIRLWNVNTGIELTAIHSGFKEAIIDLTFSADAKMLAGAGKEGDIRIWNTSNGKLLFTLTGHAKRVESLAFSPNGKMLASASWDGTMRLWDIEAERQISQHANGRIGGIIEVVFSLDGKTIVSTSTSRQIQLWKIYDNRQMPAVTLTGHNGWIRTLEFSEDGKTLASGSDDGTILLWDWEKITSLR